MNSLLYYLVTFQPRSSAYLLQMVRVRYHYGVISMTAKVSTRNLNKVECYEMERHLCRLSKYMNWCVATVDVLFFEPQIHDVIFYEFTHACKSFMILITPTSLLAQFSLKFITHGSINNIITSTKVIQILRHR